MDGRIIVCVLGMHRSGTSLAMRLVNLLGVDVGPEEHLFAAAHDNTKGFWENREIVRLNRLLLRRLGGQCMRPPKLEPGWENRPRLNGLRGRARHLLAREFGRRRSWGWKDPRTSLTLPFWRTVVEPTHYVVCVRQPHAVARSVQQRDSLSFARALWLWLVYSQSALRATTGQNVLYLSYERVVDNWDTELSRLASFVGLPTRARAPDVCEATRALVDPSLQHHRTAGAPRESADDAVAAALHLAHRAYEELCRDRPCTDDADRRFTNALALVMPIVEQEESVAAAAWDARRRQGLREIATAVRPGESFVLVDAMKWATENWINGRRRIPFLEQHGQYWGLPTDDEAAIRELQRLRDSGAAAVAFAEPAFSWLQTYPAMAAWLRQTFSCVIETNRTIVFDLRGGDERAR